ncbi:DUF732 domain-containing protein [Mycobacterium sp. CBMA293]|uniref:DUF732 domain-containing protein n=2 Tax=unclassified Mycolicibacterium TaxID=2636767 RepID=UPI00132909FC|nr:DUF732 domain-containing protein [Mycolicibacterium sp. CBMA 360]MUL60230.1 DUF732 domain-containing protein [Mycolicibacterium sp. CBMA 335]MUL71558.1 DUF732 domain-containing protein [Mycolicibacterium sp. CBMA 311]MUL96008.1 DUF732 domain-containing protein [Mycolicibacterium sp. CBMA 230]MUM08025.1 hypothetical protein [Mycolicibacterium sp. CBMA 213]MUM14168.1 DUF732 domain-containing protein [Mycolicibacterium sp. CBMA 293]MUM33941.1 DUF732 domain-containing protein [Mycolicibacteriu
MTARRWTCGLVAAALGVPAMLAPAAAHADATAYLIGVNVRPGYNFPNADAALGYGYGICDKVGAGQPFAQVMGDVRADFNTDDDYQASYLISQAVNELCPAQIWQLRKSAARYQSPPGVHP